MRHDFLTSYNRGVINKDSDGFKVRFFKDSTKEIATFGTYQTIKEAHDSLIAKGFKDKFRKGIYLPS